MSFRSWRFAGALLNVLCCVDEIVAQFFEHVKGFSRKKMNYLGERLGEEIERLGGVSAVAGKLGVARNTLYNWIEKENIPANKLLELGEAGADVQRIIGGAPSCVGEKVAPYAVERASPPIDEDLLRGAIIWLLAEIGKRRRAPSPAQLAAAIVLAYQIVLAERKVVPEKLEPILRLVA